MYITYSSNFTLDKEKTEMRFLIKTPILKLTFSWDLHQVIGIASRSSQRL